MKKHIKTILAPIIIIATVTAFGFYIKAHPDTLKQVGEVSPLALIVLILLSFASFGAYILITRISIRMYNKTMSVQENIVFNIYSSLINFFGPGQSGPIFRAAYLKKRHNLTVKQFTFTLLLYLSFLAVVSAMFMFIGSRPWWQTALLMLAAAGACALFVRRYKQKAHISIGSGFNPLNIGLLFLAVVLQLGLLAVVYGIELHQIGASPSIGQVLSYTGVSNFSIFVALTPGAIGIREGFLVFSQGLHHIATNNIVAANLLDRGMYLLFLGILGILALTMHAKDKLHVKQLQTEKAQEQS